MSEPQRTAENQRTPTLDADDRNWLEERLKAYRGLLFYLREH